MRGSAARPELVWAPGPRQTLGEIATTSGELLLSVLDNVRGRLRVLDRPDGAWRSRPLGLPENASIDIAAASDERDQAMLTVADFLTPTTLWFVIRGVPHLWKFHAKCSVAPATGSRCAKSRAELCLSA